MSDKPPAFQFYPKDFLADMNVALMSLEARGAYITLLCFCWNERGLPDDPARLGRICGVCPEKMEELWVEIEPCFEKIEGELLHPRLEKERKKQEKRRKQAQKAANARWSQPDEPPGDKPDSDFEQCETDAGAYADAMQTVSPASAVASSTASTTTTSSKSAPISEMWDVWIEELGGDPPHPRLTARRRKKLAALYAEQLDGKEDPIALFRSVLQEVKNSDHHMSKRSYQMPESTFRNEDRRDRWAKAALSPNGNSSGSQFNSDGFTVDDEDMERLYGR